MTDKITNFYEKLPKHLKKNTVFVKSISRQRNIFSA